MCKFPDIIRLLHELNFTGTAKENIIKAKANHWVFEKVRLQGDRMVLDILGSHNELRGMKFGSYRAYVFVYGHSNVIDSCEFYDTGLHAIFVRTQKIPEWCIGIY